MVPCMQRCIKPYCKRYQKKKTLISVDLASKVFAISTYNLGALTAGIIAINGTIRLFGTDGQNYCERHSEKGKISYARVIRNGHVETS